MIVVLSGHLIYSQRWTHKSKGIHFTLRASVEQYNAKRGLQEGSRCITCIMKLIGVDTLGTLRAIFVILLRKHAYQIYGKCYHKQKENENFQIKNMIFFHISAHNIDCAYPLQPPRAIRQIIYTSVNPSFTIQKCDIRESKLYRHVFVIRWTTVMTPVCFPVHKGLSEKVSTLEGCSMAIFRNRGKQFDRFVSLH